MIYFDNAATTIHKPQCVIDAVTNAMQTMGNASRGAYGASLTASFGLLEVRELLAGLFNAEDATRIAFTSNSTEALNTAINGLIFPGDHVITTVLEHNSVLRPLYRLEDQGLKMTLIGIDEYGCIDYSDIENAIAPNTRAIITTHGSNLTGNILDIHRIGQIAKEHNLLYIVDASQTAGYYDIDVQRDNIDVLCFTGHKSLLGPQGTGGLYVRTGINVHPLKVGGSGILTYDRHHPSHMPDALEAGTINGHGIAGLGAAVRYITDYGISNIRRKELSLMRAFYEGVCDTPGVKIYGDFRTDDRCPIVSLNIGDVPSAMVSDALNNSYDIATRSGGHCAPRHHEAWGTKEQGMVRFSFSAANTMSEVKAAICAIKELAE